MRSDPAGLWRRLPDGEGLLRAYALLAGALLLVGYGLFVLSGPAAASPFLAVTVPLAMLVFAILLLRRPLHLLVFSAVVGVIAVSSVFSLIVDWDARSIWFYHARFIVDGAGPRLLLGPDGPLFHPQYPKLLPLAAATIARNVGFWNEALPKFAVPILYAVPLAYVFGAWRGWVARGLLLVAAYLLCTGSFWNGYLDGLLALYTVAALAAGLRALDGDERLDAWCFAILAALLPTLKTEGILACGAVLFALAVRILTTRDWRGTKRLVRTAGPLLVAGLVVALSWFVCVQFFATKLDSNFAGDPIARLLDRLGDGHSLWLIWRDMFVKEARLVWPLAALFLFALGTPAVRRNVGPFILAAGAILLGLTMVYLLTPSRLSWHLATSIDRTTMTPMLLLAAALLPFGRDNDTQRAALPSRAAPAE